MKKQWNLKQDFVSLQLYNVGRKEEYDQLTLIAARSFVGQQHILITFNKQRRCQTTD